MQEIDNSPAITTDNEVNINRNAIEHRATWMGLSYESGKEAGADIDRILRSAVARTGCLHGAAIKEKLSGQMNLEEFAALFLTPLGIKTFEMEIVSQTEDSLKIRFHYCPLVAGWLKAGIPPEDIPTLCDIAMDGDRKIAETVGAKFELGETIAAGNRTCELEFSRE